MAAAVIRQIDEQLSLAMKPSAIDIVALARVGVSTSNTPSAGDNNVPAVPIP